MRQRHRNQCRSAIACGGISDDAKALRSSIDFAHGVGVRALAQYDRHLEPWIHGGVWDKRALSCYCRAFSGPRRPAGASYCCEYRSRISDQIIYWLAILHFGRINGIRFPCSGPGLCDQTTKAIWALFGLAPAAMFVTGAIMWWNRVLRRSWHALRRPARSPAVTAL